MRPFAPAIVLALATTLSAADDVWVPEPVTAEFLASIQEIPFGMEGASGSPEYYSIIGKGLSIVPELIDLLDDPTITSNSVPLRGGKYAVGDVAMSAISHIVRVPWLEFITSSDDPQIEAIGFGVYWNYVRKSPENRAALKSRVKEWFRKNERRLLWRPVPEIVTGGFFELPQLPSEPLVAGVDGVTNPKRIHYVQPAFPSRVRSTRLEGKVFMEVVVLKDGFAGDAKVLRCRVKKKGQKPDSRLNKYCKYFEASALDAVSKWRYQPSTKDGHPVDSRYTVIVVFSRTPT